MAACGEVPLETGPWVDFGMDVGSHGLQNRWQTGLNWSRSFTADVNAVVNALVRYRRFPSACIGLRFLRFNVDLMQSLTSESLKPLWLKALRVVAGVGFEPTTFRL